MSKSVLGGAILAYAATITNTAFGQSGQQFDLACIGNGKKAPIAAPLTNEQDTFSVDLKNMRYRQNGSDWETILKVDEKTITLSREQGNRSMVVVSLHRDTGEFWQTWFDGYAVASRYVAQCQRKTFGSQLVRQKAF